MNTRYIVCGIVQNGEKVILGKKLKGRPPYPDVWHTPGGGVKNHKLAEKLVKEKDYNNQYFHNELRREIKEELGLEIKDIKCIVPKFRNHVREAKTRNKHDELTHYYFLEYLCSVSKGKLKAADDLVKAKWVNKGDLLKVQLTPPSKEMYKELGWLS